MGYFKDLREHLAALDKAGLLVKIDEQINKDTELMPLVRWQFRGLSEEERRAFMFTNVVDAKGRKYDIPVVVGVVMVVALAYILMTIVTDLASSLADPRPTEHANGSFS